MWADAAGEMVWGNQEVYARVHMCTPALMPASAEATVGRGAGGVASSAKVLGAGRRGQKRVRGTLWSTVGMTTNTRYEL